MGRKTQRGGALLFLAGTMLGCNSSPVSNKTTDPPDPPDTSTWAVTQVLLANRPYSVAVASTGAIYVAQLDAALLARADLPTYAFDGAVSVGQVPTEVAFNSTGTKAYVTNQANQTVGVVDVASNSQTQTVAVSGNPFAIIVAPGDSMVYVTTTADSLFGISTASNAIVHRLTIPSIANGMAIHDSLLYVSTRDVGIVTQVGLRSNTVLRTFAVGGKPQGVAVSPDGTVLYVANQDGSLQIWTLTTYSSLATLPLAGPGYGVAVNPANGRIYVTTLGNYPTSGGGEVQVFDPTTRTQVASYLVGGWARRIAFNATGTVAVIANDNGGFVDFLHRGSATGGDTTSRDTSGTDTSTLTVTQVLLPSRPYSVAVASTGAVYVGELDANFLARADLPTYTFNGGASVGHLPTEVAFNSTGTKAYVTNQFSQNVGVVDVASNSQTSTVSVAGNPFAIIVAPGDSMVYVTTTADSLFGISTASNTIAHRLTIPSIANGMAIHDSLLYVSTRDVGIVTQVSLRSNTALRTLSVGGEPQGVAVSPDGTVLYVANQNGSLQIWSLTTYSALATLPLTGPGYGVALSRATGRIYVTTLGSYPASGGGEVQVFDPTTRTQVASYVVGGWARRIAFNAAGTVAVVANDNGGFVDFLHH